MPVSAVNASRTSRDTAKLSCVMSTTRCAVANGAAATAATMRERRVIERGEAGMRTFLPPSAGATTRGTEAISASRSLRPHDRDQVPRVYLSLPAIAEAPLVTPPAYGGQGADASAGDTRGTRQAVRTAVRANSAPLAKKTTA